MKNKIKVKRWQSGLVFFSKITGLIIMPIVGVVVILKWLSKEYAPSQGIIFAIIGIVLILSFLGIVREIKRELKKSKKEK